MADNYNYDMQRLQQDAIRRAREMQARAQSFAPPQPPAAPVNPAPPEPQRHIPPAEPRHAPHRESPPQGNREQPDNHPLSPFGDIFDGLMKDSERTLIIVLILLLVEERASPEIIFALMYLVL